MPSWPHWNYDWMREGILAYFFGPFLFSFVLPLLAVLAQLPFAAVRPLFSSTRWLIAYSSWPSEMKIIWKTTKAEAPAGVEYMARKLEQGYEGLTHPGTELVFMTRPAGLDDLDR